MGKWDFSFSEEAQGACQPVEARQPEHPSRPPARPEMEENRGKGYYLLTELVARRGVLYDPKVPSVQNRSRLLTLKSR